MDWFMSAVHMVATTKIGMGPVAETNAMVLYTSQVSTQLSNQHID